MAVVIFFTGILTQCFSKGFFDYLFYFHVGGIIVVIGIDKILFIKKHTNIFIPYLRN